MALLLSGSAPAAEVPPWWPYEEALKPQWRMEGDKLSSTDGRRAEGELILARFYGVQGDLPREMLHLERFFESDPKDPVLLCLGWHEKAAVLRQLGQDSPRKSAIENYGRHYDHGLAIRAGLESPKVMEAWRLVDKGDYAECERMVTELSGTDDAKTDGAMLAALGFLESEIKGRQHRDPKYAKEALLKLMDPGQLGPRDFLADPNLVVAAVVSLERLFQPEAALELISAASGGRQIMAPVIPEAEMARNELLLCHWDKAAEYLAKAQKILLTYPPGIRQEAGKNLDFAVVDHYLATGHPYEALPLLERLHADFLRPGFTTEHVAYYLAGLHLRIGLASDRILRLQWAALGRSGPSMVAKALPGFLRLVWIRERSGILFRQELTDCIAKADPGRDIGTLVFAPPWLLPEMKRILGEGTFNGLFSKFRPEGRRLAILHSLLNGSAMPEDITPLLRALSLALGKTDARKMEAWSIAPSATLLVGVSLPVSFPADECPSLGWIGNSAHGLRVKPASLSPEEGTLLVEAKGKDFNIPVKWPLAVAGRIENLNKALLNADSMWGRSRQLSIEGRDMNAADGSVVP